MLHLTDADVDGRVDAADAERAVWSAFAAWGRGEAATTHRVRASTDSSMASAMAAVVPPYCGGKLYATKDGRFTFVIVLFDTDGQVLATLDGDAITRLRTPAASSLAIHHFAAADVTTATLVGTGVQAWPHLCMLGSALPEVTELRICGRPDGRSAAGLARRATSLGLPATAYDDPVAAVTGAQVIVTVTTSQRPLFPASVVADDALICAVGATKRQRIEIGADVVERCRSVVCDDVGGAQNECGDLIAAAAEGRFDWSRAVELHAVAAGTCHVDRAGDGPVLFETQGVAVQDVAVAGLAFERHSATVGSADVGGRETTVEGTVRERAPSPP